MKTLYQLLFYLALTSILRAEERVRPVGHQRQEPHVAEADRGHQPLEVEEWVGERSQRSRRGDRLQQTVGSAPRFGAQFVRRAVATEYYDESRCVCVDRRASGRKHQRIESFVEWIARDHARAAARSADGAREGRQRACEASARATRLDSRSGIDGERSALQRCFTSSE